MTEPYYSDDAVTLYLGDCRDIEAWLDADVLVTDPPYGRQWRQNAGLRNSSGQGIGKAHRGIAGDESCETRDDAVRLWGDRHGLVFGDPLIPAPMYAVQALVFAKSDDAGIKGARGGFRRDAELVHMIGPWRASIGGRSSILRTGAWTAGPTGAAARFGHSHAKPVDVMEALIDACPPGVIADPFAGSGSTLVAARNLGRKAIGVELEERYAEVIAKRLSQMALDFSALEEGMVRSSHAEMDGCQQSLLVQGGED